MIILCKTDRFNSIILATIIRRRFAESPIDRQARCKLCLPPVGTRPPSITRGVSPRVTGPRIRSSSACPASPVLLLPTGGSQATSTTDLELVTIQEHPLSAVLHCLDSAPRPWTRPTSEKAFRLYKRWCASSRRPSPLVPPVSPRVPGCLTTK